MKGRLLPPLAGIAVCVALVGLAWAIPRMSDDEALTRFLASKRILPELMPAVAPVIRQAFEQALLLAATGLFAAFAVWTADATLVSPTGPGQVTGIRRRVTWWLIAIAVFLGVFLVAVFGPLGDRGHIDGNAAYQFSALLALLDIFLFWTLSLFGTERLVRPAVPAGSVLVGQG